MQRNRVVPEAPMEAVPIARLDELRAHIAELSLDPEKPIDMQLFDEVELQLNDANVLPLLHTLLLPLTQLLRDHIASPSWNPEPMLSMAAKLLTPFTFSRALDLADPTSILTALLSPLRSANMLGLTMLHKAARGPDDATLLSTAPELIAALLNCWLNTEFSDVSERAAMVLGDVLETDCDVVENVATNGDLGLEIPQRRVPGHGHVWNLIFGSEQLFAIIPRSCRLAPPEDTDADSPLRRAYEISVSQGRLLRLLVRLATLNLHALSQTQFPELVPLPQDLALQTDHGLLQWAALAMVDMSDVLLLHNLIDFFKRLVCVMRVANSDPASTMMVIRRLVRAATADNQRLRNALTDLPNTMVEEEAEPLRTYIGQLLN